MTDAAAAVEAAKKALEEAQQALKAAEDAAKTPTDAATATPTDAAVPESSATSGPLSAEQIDTIQAGYAFAAPALEMGALVNGEPLADVPVRIPIAMTNRHGLVAGATGTGKTKTLQVLAEQLSANGVPVFAADIKGDLSGIATPGQPNPKLTARTASIGQDWAPAAAPTEFYSLGGIGAGIPIRATISSFGPLLLSKVLGLNETQESSLGLVFHYADQAGLPLLDLADLRSVLSFLTSDDGKAELKNLGGLSSATVGVILRELITFADQGADVFFGEPEIDTAQFLRTAADGRGIVSLLEVPSVRDQPALFSTFLMWLLADLFNDLPEVGDTDKPKLVFFFDEAHLLFSGASKDFIASIVQTVRLIRSKGVGIFFVTQTPKDVPNDVLAQLGSRVQHQLRAHTPDDAKALRATVSTYPTSGYDLGEVLTSLATGEAIVTVMNEKGAPSPVAWTRLRAPQGSMEPTDAATIAATVNASPLLAEYGTAIDRESAREILAARMNAAAEADAAEEAREQAEKSAAAEAQARAKAQADYEKAQREWERAEKRTTSRTSTTRRTTSRPSNPVGDVLGSQLGKTMVREVLRGIFGTLKRR
ncbi:helicase HerA-like domain-containing protein [Salinibacterium sp. ZJ450]|uniref:helicase HerA-like domain-containing protein n=1 Tax=Salinibacterium sp. ZJ450 TaxID=2708338 RepID=UPI00141FDEED|nr:helicase HerA-like domain-containing protein [Salinibacterium sp. ZJ450]